MNGTSVAVAEDNIIPLPLQNDAQTVSKTVAQTDPQPAVESEDIPTVSETVAGPSRKETWLKSKFSNLWKSGESGIYFVRAKVHGRQIRKSLKTTSVEIAKIKMDALLSTERDQIGGKPDDELVFDDFAREYIKRLTKNPDIKPTTVKYREETLKIIRKTWPRIDQMPPEAFTDQTVADWAMKVRFEPLTDDKKPYSPTRYNGVVQTMRGVLQIAMDKKLLRDNPARGRKRNSKIGIPQAPVPVIPPNLPEREKFNKLLERLDARPDRAHAADMVRFLAYSGCRIGAARLIYPEHIDLAKGEIRIPAIKFEKGFNTVPMIDEMKTLCKRLLFEHPGPGYGPLLRIANPRKALSHSCKEAGIEALTNHDLRHLFATICIESGVDLRTTASLIGHKDNGALLLRRYSHVRKEHAKAMAKKVNFGVAEK